MSENNLTPIKDRKQFIQQAMENPEYLQELASIYRKTPSSLVHVKDIPYCALSRYVFVELTKGQALELRDTLNDFLANAKDSQRIILDKKETPASLALGVSITEEIKLLSDIELEIALENEYKTYVQRKIDKLRKFYLG